MSRSSLSARVWWLPALALYALLAATGDRSAVDLGLERIAAHRLFGVDGLHLYARFPDVQVGPLGLVVVRVVDTCSAGHPLFATSVVAGLLLAVVLWTVRQLGHGPGLVVGSILVSIAWAQVVPPTGHLEDLIAITLSVLALRCVRRGRGIAAGALIALATDCKPWALLTVGVLLILGRRDLLRAGVSMLLVLVASWLPFVIAAPATVSSLGGFHIVSAASSLPALLGEPTAPGWMRPAQLVVALALAAVVVRRGAWWSLLLVAFGARIVLDAGTYGYYTVGVVVGAYVADLAGEQRSAVKSEILAKLPVATLLTSAGLLLSAQLTGGSAVFFLRTAACVVPLLLSVGATATAAKTAPIASRAG